MQQDISDRPANNPFTAAHKHTAREADKRAAAQEIVQRDARITDTAARKKAALKPEKPYKPEFAF